jgi:membrane dipeptidase
LRVFDGHNDALLHATAVEMTHGRPDGHLDLPRMRQTEMAAGMFAVFTPSAETDHDASTERNPGIDFPANSPVSHREAVIHSWAAVDELLKLERDGQLRVARTIDDVTAATPALPTAVLHLEGAEAVGEDLQLLDFWSATGVRSIGPLWSRESAFGVGVPIAFGATPDIGPGLTERGLALVRACAERRILVDVSHMNFAAFQDVAKLDLGPLVATHSGVHALCACSRNLLDEQLDAIQRSKGLVAIPFATPFIASRFDTHEDATVDDVIAHIVYVANRIGVEHVALGSDFDGAPIPRDIGDVSGISRVLAALESHGLSAGEVEQVSWRNWERVLSAWWGSAKGSD